MQELMTMLGDLLGRKFSAMHAELEALRAQVADRQARLDTLRAQVTLNQTNITFLGTVQHSLTLGDDGLLRKKKRIARKDGLPTVRTHTEGRSPDRPHTRKT